MLTEAGLKRKTYNDIYEEMVSELGKRLGQDINTSETSPLGMMLQVFAWHLSVLWEDVEQVYHESYIQYATGVQLDALAVFYGLRRKLEQPAHGSIELSGTAGYTVQAGLQVGTKAGVWFTTTAACTLDDAGRGTVNLTAVVAGISGNVPAGSITDLMNPVKELTGVTNARGMIDGRERENDVEFRDRLRAARDGSHAATIDAIVSALLQLPDVKSASVRVNNTMDTDAEGIPPKSVRAYVYGGQSEQIAKAIFDKKAAGIGTDGTESVQVRDVSGSEHEVRFSRMTMLDVHVEAAVSANPTFPARGMEDIVTAIAQYIGGIGADQQDYTGLAQGSRIVYSRLLTAVQNVIGVEEVMDLKVKLADGEYVSGNVDIPLYHVARVAPERIKVAVTHV
ncbi:baseplate J/gp47 family protein [Paenibacillus profundus]|uniref:Baseplate J/gp47 family protein n=1 Tax=Paenibacillus profundus TaxID=1173085 RepID=A0ABS8YBX5_9BACL|nr:baseplate J/gp47 family protein [Paenibacillus profundus]MCE5168962.1 baseplate J/gp47 family protein [Paenibacillus profundus]